MSYKQLFLLSFLVLYSTLIKAQTGFGTNSPANSAVVEMTANNKGFLVPRVNLQGTNDNFLPTPTIANPVDGLTVFNLSTINDVSVGYYYFNTATNRWIKIADSNSSWNLTGNSSTIPGSHFLGTTDDQDLIFKRNNIQSGLLNLSRGNTSFGIGALNPLTTGSNNLALGYQALSKNTTGNYNIATGYQSLFNNDIGNNNYAGGYQSLYNNTTGNDNLAIGGVSLLLNTTGSNNIAVGYQSLYSNRTGSYNLGVGLQSLYYNETGNNNTAIGFASLMSNRANDNTAIGSAALGKNVTGSENVAVGANSLPIAISGDKNTAIGSGSFKSFTTGSRNVALGVEAAGNLETGNNNIAIGANTNFASINSSNQLNIGNSIFGVGLDGNVSSPKGSIGINISQPNSTLQIAGSIATNVRILSNTVVADNDYTVLVEGNISLPIATALNKGRIYCLINNTNSSQVLSPGSGSFFREKGVNTNTYTLNNAIGSTGIVVQSTGAEWLIISKY